MPLTSVLHLILQFVITHSFCYEFTSALLLDSSVFSEEYRVIFPRVHEIKSRRRREINRNFHYEETVPGKIVKFDDWILDLNEDESSLNFHSKFRVIYSENEEDDHVSVLNHCQFISGKIRGFEDDSFGTVSICGPEIFGFIRIAEDSYLIEPFNSTNQFEDDVPHLFYKTKHRFKRSNFDKHERKWEYFNLTGDTIDLDEFSEEDLRSESENVTQNGDYGHIVEYEVSQPDVDITLFDWDTQEIDQDITGYFVDSAWESKVVNRKKSGVITSNPPQWLEIALAVDHTVISFHGKDRVKQYILSLMNIVNAIYQDPSLDANLQLVITRLFFYESRRASVIRLGDAKRSLQNVNAWNRKLYDNLQLGEPAHDIAVWLTRADIGGPSGYAPVSGVCDPKRSCTLNRDEGLTSAFIIAHEIAHTYVAKTTQKVAYNTKKNLHLIYVLLLFYVIYRFVY